MRRFLTSAHGFDRRRVIILECFITIRVYIRTRGLLLYANSPEFFFTSSSCADARFLSIGERNVLNSRASAQALLYSEFHRNLQNGNCVYEGFVTSSLQFALLWNLIPIYRVSCGHAVAQLVEALRYKPEGRGFDSLYCH